MKKEAINTFGEGIIMDLNPLTTPSNVLTNALNATIITYNGNEFVLQNDMGNGRVETAYLPAGYVPVGIKEYGGIIYVASYNPLTNKGQIGSFPSPERNISSQELERAKVIISPSNFKYLNGILDQTIVKVEIFPKDTILRSGDKFTILLDSANVNSLKLFISNFLNASGSKATSPKNKLLTLSVAVLDSNNNLRDITSQLKRFDANNKVITFDASASPILKFNSGYFIQTMSNSESTDVDEFRKKHAVNTYNNKVFGNLYLVASLNVIDSIGVSTFGYRNTTDADVSYDDIEVTVPAKNAAVIFEVEYKYNCPDGIYGSPDSSIVTNIADVNTSYNSYYGNSSEYSPSNVILGTQFSTSRDSSKATYTLPFHTNPASDKSWPIYDLNTGLYDRKVRGQLNLPIKENVENDTLVYSAIPCMEYTKLPGLEINGSINLAKLGSGDISMKVWRYYCNPDSMTLTWGLEAYPRHGTAIESVIFEFYDIFTASKVMTYTAPRRRSYNGSFTETFNFGVLQPRRLYLVRIAYKLNTDNKDYYTTVGYRWMFTTTLYNAQYFRTDESFVDDFANLDVDTLNKLVFNIEDALKLLSRLPSAPIISDESYMTNEAKEYNTYKNSKTKFVYSVNPVHELEGAEKYPFKVNEASIETEIEVSRDNEETKPKMTIPEITLIGTAKPGNINGYKEYKFQIDKTSTWDESKDDVDDSKFFDASNNLIGQQFKFDWDDTANRLRLTVITLSRLYTNTVSTSITLTNPYVPFITKDTIPDVFGFNPVEDLDGRLINTKEIGFRTRDRGRVEREIIDYFWRDSTNAKSRPNYYGGMGDTGVWQIKEKDDLHVRDFRDKVKEVIQKVIAERPICVIVGNPGAYNHSNVFDDSSNTYEHIKSKSDKFLGGRSNQILLWYDGNDYVWVEDFCYGNSSYPTLEMTEIVYRTFKNVLIQKGTAVAHTFFSLNKKHYAYNAEYDASVEGNLTCSSTYGDEILISEDGSFIYTSDSIKEQVNKVLEQVDAIISGEEQVKEEDVTEIVKLATFNHVDNEDFNIPVEVTVEAPGMEDVYNAAVGVADGSTFGTVAVLYDNTVVPLDYDDKPFISGAIYYAEENKDVKLATVSSGANVIRNLKVQDGTLMVKQATKVTKQFEIVAGGAATWYFDGLPVTDIEFKDSKAVGTNWGKLSVYE